MARWRTIDSAPQGETVLVAWKPPGSVHFVGDPDWFIHAAKRLRPGAEFIIYNGDAILHCEPTHWMPLPKPPVKP